jgi:hypothetical protein
MDPSVFLLKNNYGAILTHFEVKYNSLRYNVPQY